MNDRINKLYSLLIDNGYTVQDLGTEDVFRTRMADKENRKQLYDYALSNGHYLGEYDAYEAKFTNPAQSAEKVADTTSLLKDSPYAAQFAGETPEEKAARELKAQERRQRRRDGINSVFAATMPGMVSNEYVQSQMKADEPVEPTEEQKKAAEDERLFKQHLEDSGQIRELYEMRDKARENDGRHGVWSYMNPLDETAPIGGAIHLLRSAFSEDYRAKKAAQKRNRLIAEQADKAIDVYEQATGDRNGVSSLFNAVADEASRISTWDLGLTDLRNAATLYDLSQKDEGELTAAEKATLDAIGLASSVMSLYGDELGMGYKIGQGVPATLSFMGSMALNPLSGYGKKLAGDAVKKFGKDYIKRVAKRASGDILETGAYVGSVALPQVAANALDRINGSTTYELDDDLNVVYGGQENQETLGNAIWKALGETFIEGYTERVGDYFDPIIGFAKGVTKGIKAGKLSDFAEALVDVKPTATMQNIRRFKEKTLFNGTLSELMEEELGMAMNAFTVGDYTFNKEEAEKEGKTYIFDPETQFTTAMSVGMFSAAINGTEMAANHAYKRKVNKVAEEYGKIAERELGAQFSEMIDGVPSLKERIDNADADEKNRIINDIFASPNLSDKQKQAAATYAVYRQYAQTFNAVQANALNHKADEVKEQHAAYEAGYSSALPAFYNIANAFKEAEQAISDYTEKTGDSSVADAIRLIENNPSEIKNVRDGLTDEQYQLVTNYINNLERYKGAYKGRSDKLEDYVDEYAFALEPAINADANGNRTITTAIYKDEPVYVLYNDGTNATIMRFNGEKLGEKTPLLTKFLSEIVSHDAEQYINDYRRQITGQMNAETENAFEHHPKTQAPQVRLQLQSPEGEVVITAVNDNMVEIVPAVYKDGQVQPKEGAEPRTITVDDAYAWQDDYYLRMDADQAYANAMAEANNMSSETTENEGTPTEQIEQSVSEEVTDGQNIEIQPTEEVAESVAPAVPQTARERVPKDKKGNPIYEQTDADTAWDAIVEETEGDTEMAQRVAADMLEDKKAALAKLQNGKPKKGATVAEKIANEKAHAAAIAQAQNDIAQWEAIVGTEARRREAAMSEAERYAAEMEQKNISEGLKALGEPQSLEEYVLGQLAGGSYKLRWSDKENGTKGFGSHTGLSTEEMKARLSMIDNKNGLTPEEIAHSIVENMDASFGEVDMMDVTNMVIDAVSTHASRRAMLNGMVESRAELLRQQEIAEQEAKDAWYMEQYHATEEELAAYNEYLAEFAEEIYGEDTDYEQRIATFAEIQLGEYDNQGTDAGLRSSADQGEGLDSDREGGRSVGEREQTDRREVLADANGVAEAEDQGVGSSVSEESDVNFTREELENGDVRITGTNSNGQIASVATERDGKVISVDSYDDGVLFERTDYDENGQATKVTRFNEKGEVVLEEQYINGKKKVYGTEDVSEGEPRGRRSQEKGGIAEARREVGQDVQKRINEYEQQTGWTNGLESREVDIINYVRTLTDKELVDFKRNMLDNIKKGKSGRDYVGILNAVRKYEQSGERQYVKDASGIELNQPVSLETLEQLFSEYNYDEELAILFDRIFPLIQQINPKITFEVIKDGGKDRESVLGDYLLKDKHIRINYHSLYSGYQTSQEKASTIVHEMLHAVTQYAIDANERGVEMPAKLKDAAKSFVNIYNAVKDNPILAEEYGIKDVHEMISELANPEFRDKLRQIDIKGESVWQRLLDVFKRLINKFSDIYDVSAYGKAVDALDNLLGNFDGSLYAQMQEFDYEPKQKVVTDKADEDVLFRDENSETIRYREAEPFYSNAERELQAKPVVISKTDDNLRFRDGAPFFSNAEQAVENIKQNKATPEQWLAMIKKDGGLKAGEDKWMGLSDWLNEQKEKGVKTLTKDEVLAFIRENQIEIEEVEYGDNPIGFDELKEEYEAMLRDEGYDAAHDAMVERFGDDFDIVFEDLGGELAIVNEEAAAALLGSENIINATRLDYTTEGLDNKREIALVVPSIESWNESDTVHFGDAGEGRAVAWARFGETTDEDGNRVLVIDEVQSKRHDEGRAKGYQSKEKGELLAERERLYGKMYSEGLTEEEFNRRNEINARLEELGEGIIPDAPFDKNYHELVMKRMLRYAAENGFDKVAWTKGEQQAERYGIGTKINHIHVVPNAEERYVSISPIGGRIIETSTEPNSDIIISGEYKGKSLSEVYGKTLADKIMSVETGSDERIAGDGLRIGGEGMKGYYDEMIPRFMNKYVKKWGTKVGEVTLPNVEAAGRTMWSVDVTPEMKESVMQGQPMFREGMGAISDREVSYENDPIAKFQGKPRYYGKRAAAFAERERRRMENAAKEASEMLGIEVEIVTDVSTLQGRKAKAKGWYDIVNKKVVVVVPNHVSMGDAVRTVLHEGVAHHGLRELFGDSFDAMLDNVYNNVAPELKARIDAIAERTGVSAQVATEEYLASLAETTNFEEAQRRGWWAKIKQYFVKMLDKLGMPGLNLKEELTGNELRYLLWRSYKNLVEPNSYLKPLGYIDDVAKQKELKVGEYAENKQAVPIAAEMSEAEELEAEEWAEVTMQRIDELEAQAAQLENEISEMEAKREADDASRYDMWEGLMMPLRMQLEDVYAEIEGLYTLSGEEEVGEEDREAEKQRQLYQKRIDNAYLKAVREGDWEEATDLFRQYVLSKAEDEGIVPMDYGVGYRGGAHSSIAKKVKEENPDAIAEAAYQMSIRIPKGSILVPMPSRTGNATYTVKLAEAIAKSTDSEVRDVLKGKARMSVYEAKQRGIKMTPEDLGMYTTEELPKGKNIVIIDNVIDKGTTALAAVSAVKGASVVAYAYTLGDKQRVASLKLAEPVTYDDNMRIIPLSQRFNKKTDDIRYRTSEEIEVEVERESAALGVPVRIARSVDEFSDEDTRKRAVDGKLKGYYDPRTNEVVLYAPNTDDANDAKRTILHEIVGHKGMRQLIGEQRYDKSMVQLMYMLPSEVRDAVLRRAERHGWNAAIAMDEYLAEQAERDVQPTWWGKVNAKIRALFRNMGFNVMLTDADVTYLLWRSRKKLQGDTAFDMATDAILKQAARKSAEAEAWSEQAFKDMEMMDFERNALPSIRHRMGADTNDYEKTVRTFGFKQSEAWQDHMRSLLVFQQALAKASGKDISDFENAYMYENRMSSANLMEMEQYRHMVYNPLLKEIHELEQMGASRESIINYLFAKSGLERNEVFARRDAKKHAEGDATKEQQLYDKYRQKDYAGLTALTRGDAQIAALVDDHSDKKTKYDRLEQNKKRGVAVSDADLKAAKKKMDDARKAMITAIESEAQRMVDEFERAHNTDNLWDKIRNCTHTTLDISHDAGVMSDEVYSELWNQFQYYIPLRGFAETTAEDVYLYLGGNDSPYNAPIKTAYGRTSLADDPIATIGNMAESAIVEANRNRLKQRFLYMVERHNTDLASISDVWLEYDEVNDEWHTVFAQIPDDATPSEAKRLQQEFEDRMKQLAEQNPGKYANASQQPNIPYRVVKKGDRQEHHVIVKRNGKDVVITINGNPRVAQAINGLTNPEQNQGMITRITSWINRNLSANFTMRNPAFMVSNFVRDGFYTNSMVWVKENPAYAWQYNKNWAICTAQIASLVSRYKRYEKGDTNALDMNNDMDRMFYEFMINGGETGYTVIKSVEDYKGLISGEMKKMEAGAMGTARRVADKIGDVVDTFGRWAEDTSRFAAYMTSRQLGRTVTKSIWDAKEISVNFNKKGSGNRMSGKFEQGNRWNYLLSNMSQLGRNLYVFWNAGVQGFNNFKKAAKDSPAKFTAMAGTYFTLGVIVAAAFSGDDDEDDYYNLPEYVRRNNICFKIGKGKYATLPLPIEIRAIYGLGELAYSYLSGREGLTHGEAVTKVIQQMTQVMPIDMMADGGGAMALVPSAAKPVVEVIHNVDWTGRPIYKEKTPWNQNDPTWTLAFKSTNPELVKMSRRVNEWTNKDTAEGLERPYNRGWADNRYLNNPAVWEHIAEGYLGGMATMFNQSVKSTMALWNEDLREVRNVPIVSRFVKDAGKEGRSYAARNEYYEAKNVMDSWRNEMSKAKKEVLDGSLTDQQRVNAAKLRSSLEAQYAEAFAKWKELDKQRDNLEKVLNTDISDQAKEEARKSLDDVMIQMATLVDAYR